MPIRLPRQCRQQHQGGARSRAGRAGGGREPPGSTDRYRTDRLPAHDLEAEPVEGDDSCRVAVPVRGNGPVIVASADCSPVGVSSLPARRRVMGCLGHGRLAYESLGELEDASLVARAGGGLWPCCLRFASWKRRATSQPRPAATTALRRPAASLGSNRSRIATLNPYGFPAYAGSLSKPISRAADRRGQCPFSVHQLGHAYQGATMLPSVRHHSSRCLVKSCAPVETSGIPGTAFASLLPHGMVMIIRCARHTGAGC